MNSTAMNPTSTPSVQLAQVSTDALDATTMDSSALQPAVPDTLPDVPWESTLSAPDAAVPSVPSDPWTMGNSGLLEAGDTSWLDGPRLATDAAANLAQTGADAPSASLSQLLDVQHWVADSAQIQDSINHGLEWVVTHFRPFFQTVRAPIDATLTGVEGLLTSVPSMVMIALMVLLAWQFAGRAIAIGTLVSLAVVALLGIWPEAMVTLSLVLTSLAFCILIGLPVGIALAASDRAQRWTRPFLDAMQTTPAFVYLVPVVMLFGIGNVPGVIVTIVFALPPLIRLTNLGIRQVRPDLIEASRAYGASPMQMLFKVQLPLAMPSIMAGINQALMLSLSMVVIASMIAVGGLGQMVLRGIGRLDMGLATVGGLGIVLLAIALDRITQAMGKPQRGGVRWSQRGPLGWLLRSRRARPVEAPAPAAATSASAPTAPAATNASA